MFKRRRQEVELYMYDEGSGLHQEISQAACNDSDTFGTLIGYYQTCIRCL